MPDNALNADERTLTVVSALAAARERSARPSEVAHVERQGTDRLALRSGLVCRREDLANWAQGA